MATSRPVLPACCLFWVSSLLLLIPACEDDLCKSQPPALEVKIILGSKIKARVKEIKALLIDVTAKPFARSWISKFKEEPFDGVTSFTVALGPAVEGDFKATVLVRAMNAKGAEVARGQEIFSGSGDACNFFELELGSAVDGGAEDAGDGGVDLGVDASDSGPDISDAGGDRSMDQKKPDMLLDATLPDICPSGDFSGSKKTCTKNTDCDDKLACTVDICAGCVCYNEVKVGRCLVGGACYTAGAVNAKNKCQRCEPSSSSTGWAYFSAPGCVTTLAGQGINGWIDGPAAFSRFHEPHGVAVDKDDGSVYVADHYNNKLRVISKAGKVSTLISFNVPDGVDVHSGTLYLADSTYHQITTFKKGVLTDIAGKVGTAGHDNGKVASATFNTPADVAVDSTGKIYVADTGNHVIRLIDNGIVSTLAGTPLKSGLDNTPGSVLFNGPHGVALDNKGYVYVADRNNHVIRKILIETGVVSTLAGSPNGVSGHVDSNIATSARFYRPTSVALDNTGKVYVVDNGNHLIRLIEKKKNNFVVSTLAGTAKKPGFLDGELLTAKFNTPRRLAVDAFGMVQVADRLNHKIRTINTGGYWVAIKAGTFSMGSPASDPCRNVANEFKHAVTLTHGIEIQATEVTQDQFYAVMGYEPWSFKYCGGTCPVENVNWHEAVAYCNALSNKAGKAQCYTCTGTKGQVKCTQASGYTNIYACPGYRLPTEAEWENAYRAGSTPIYYNGSGKAATCTEKEPTADKIGWSCFNSKVVYVGGQKPKCSTTQFAGPHPVGARQANAWGLYDMAGNVWEWCHDGYQANLGSIPITDPVGSGPYTVTRGGAWNRSPTTLRAAARGLNAMGSRVNDLGFRCVRTTK